MNDVKRNLTPLIDPDAGREPLAARQTGIPAVACVLLQLILAYEWLISGLDKIGTARFDSQLVVVLQQGTQGSRYGWYVSLLHQFVLPNHSLFALLVQVTEPALGLALLLGGSLGLLRPYTRIIVYGALAASAALLGSAFLSLNYFFQGNCPIPWINTSNSFVPGVNINILVALISLVLLAANLRLLYQSRPTTVE